MSTEENKATFRRITEEIFNKGNLDITDEVIAPNYVYHSTTGDYTGREGFRQWITQVRTGFPDVNMVITDMVAEGEKVAVRFSYTGTHLGESAGIPPTGNKINMEMFLFIRFENGKQAEEWPCVDTMALMQQLGVIPPQ